MSNQRPQYRLWLIECWKMSLFCFLQREVSRTPIKHKQAHEKVLYQCTPFFLFGTEIFFLICQQTLKLKWIGVLRAVEIAERDTHKYFVLLFHHCEIFRQSHSNFWERGGSVGSCVVCVVVPLRYFYFVRWDTPFFNPITKIAVLHLERFFLLLCSWYRDFSNTQN